MAKVGARLRDAIGAGGRFRPGAGRHHHPQKMAAPRRVTMHLIEGSKRGNRSRRFINRSKPSFDMYPEI